jgi:hypothetical protein
LSTFLDQAPLHRAKPTRQQPLASQNVIDKGKRNVLFYWVLWVKVLSATFILTLLFSVLVLAVHFGTVRAEISIPKPSVPEFTAKANATAIEVTIKNQPLSSYENGSYPSLYYGFKFKDVNARVGFWEYDPIFFVGSSTYGGYYKASDSEFTAVSLSLEGYDFPSGQIDIQAIALVGNQYATDMQNGAVYGFEGEMSGWSNTQTLTITSSGSPSPTSPEPDMDQTGVVEVILALALIAIVIGAGLGLLIYLMKRK